MNSKIPVDFRHEQDQFLNSEPPKEKSVILKEKKTAP